MPATVVPLQVVLVVGLAPDHLRAAALGEQVEEVVADPGGEVRVVRGVVALERTQARVAVVRVAVGVRVVQPAQVAAGALVDLLAEEVVRGVLGVLGVELDHRAHHVGRRLVEPAGVTEVVEPGGVRGDAVAHLVAGDVELHQLAERRVAVAVRHAEAGVVPERVLVPGAEVHARVGADAVATDAEPAEGVLVEAPRLGGAVVRVGRGALAVGGGAVAEDLVGAGHQRAARGRWWSAPWSRSCGCRWRASVSVHLVPTLATLIETVPL